jgi:hypothetical protein
VLTSGGIGLFAEMGIQGARLIGPGLDVGVSFGDFSARFERPGTMVDFSGGLPSLVQRNPATVNGVRFTIPPDPNQGGDTRVFTGSSFRVSAAPVLVGPNMVTPFSLTGTVFGFETFSGPPVFTVDVAATGRLFTGGNLFNVGGVPEFRILGINLNFEPASTPSPTPEPTTFLLLGTGLLGAVVRRFRNAAPVDVLHW